MKHNATTLRLASGRAITEVAGSAVIAAVLLLAATGCGEDTSGAASDPSSRIEVTPETPKVDLTILYRYGSTNPLVVHDSPADAALAASTVAVGTVKGYAEGPIEVSSYKDGTEDHDRFIVIEVAVDKMLKAGPGHDAKEQTLYLLRRRGIEGYDANGKLIGKSPALTVDDFSAAIPVGTRLIVMANDRPKTPAPGIELTDLDRGVPAGAAPLDVALNQTMLFDAGPQTQILGWEARSTFAEAQSSIEKALS